jgi:signal transduction histidine kinase
MDAGAHQPMPLLAMFRRPVSLRLKLTVWMIGLFSIIAVVMLGVFWIYERADIQRRLQEQVTNFAGDIAHDLAPLLPELTAEEVARVRQARLNLFPLQPFQVEVVSADGTLVAGEAGLRASAAELGLEGRTGPPEVFVLPLARASMAPPEARHTWAAASRIRAADGRMYDVVVLTTDAVFRRRVSMLTQVAIGSALIGIFAAGATAWFIAGVAVAPFDRLRTLAQRLEPGAEHEEPARVSQAADVAGLSEELEHARERIRERFVAQERFLSHVSHEIKTPIAIVLVEAQTLNTRTASEEIRRFVASTQDELTRLGRMLESLLALTRIRNGERAPRQLACGINDVVMESIENCRNMASQHHVSVVPRLLADDDCIDATVSGDPELLRTMLDNLVRNAIRFSPEHGRVDVRIDCSADSITVGVCDQGPGVPPDVLPTIFDRYVSPRDAGRSARGHGLGLAIAQGIAELHGGRITATNGEAGGCVFSVTLPRAPANEPPTAAGAERNGVSTPLASAVAPS